VKSGSVGHKRPWRNASTIVDAKRQQRVDIRVDRKNAKLVQTHRAGGGDHLGDRRCPKERVLMETNTFAGVPVHKLGGYTFRVKERRRSAMYAVSVKQATDFFLEARFFLCVRVRKYGYAGIFNGSFGQEPNTRIVESLPYHSAALE
jgi:hypothetical protein